MRFSFRFRLLPFIAMLVVVAIGVSLGLWQLRRAAEKEAIEQRIMERAKEPPLRLGGVAASARRNPRMIGRPIARKICSTAWPTDPSTLSAPSVRSGSLEAANS